MKDIVNYINEGDYKHIHYEIEFLEYDPEVLSEYENGDISDDELHDAIVVCDKVDPQEFIVADKKVAIEHAEEQLKKVVKTYSEVCGCALLDTDANPPHIVKKIFI